MFSIRNINPVVRAVGTMGAVAALVGGVTFATLNSNQVALGPNTLTAATTKLAIGPTNCGTTAQTQAGFTGVTLSPGQSSTVSFCLDNTNGTPLNLTSSVLSSAGDATALTTSSETSATTLVVDCGSLGTASGTLDSFSDQAFANPLAANTAINCTATATLSSSYSGTGAAIPSFDVVFTGTPPSTT